MLEDLYSYTHGNPSYLSEIVQFLLEMGKFKDQHGSWSPQVLKDLGLDLEGSGAVEFVKKRLKKKLDILFPVHDVRSVLFILVLFIYFSLSYLTLS